MQCLRLRFMRESLLPPWANIIHPICPLRQHYPVLLNCWATQVEAASQRTLPWTISQATNRLDNLKF
jgi:hypothetical protein